MTKNIPQTPTPENLKNLFNQLATCNLEKLPKTQEELKDLFDLYLECDIAGDNQDRRNKLEAVNHIQKLLSIINNANLSFEVG